MLVSVSVGPSKNFSGARHSTLVPRMTTEKRCFEMRSGKLTQFARSHCESALNPVDSRLRGYSCSGVKWPVSVVSSKVCARGIASTAGDGGDDLHLVPRAA